MTGEKRGTEDQPTLPVFDPTPDTKVNLPRLKERDGTRLSMSLVEIRGREKEGVGGVLGLVFPAHGVHGEQAVPQSSSLHSGGRNLRVIHPKKLDRGGRGKEWGAYQGHYVNGFAIG